MKQIIFIFSILLATVFYATAQTTTLTFTGRNQNNGYVQLDHVIIKNLTKNWQETLYWPDTVLTMTYTGIENPAGANDNLPLQIIQNNPNPFDGTTYATLILTKDGDVSVEITDVSGRIVGAKNFSPLQMGTHQLYITLSTAGMYFLTARQNGLTTSIKMVNRGNGGTDNIAITSNGWSQFTASALPKHTNSNKGTTNNPFNIGDQMEYIGYIIENGVERESSHPIQSLTSSETIQLQFITSHGDSQPCPGTPTLTDYDGNVYNTVQIGNQCWMKENLRTTHFATGLSIELGNSANTTTCYRYYPNNDSSNVFMYGYLYNWKAAIGYPTNSSDANPSGIRGICPNGWHLPSSSEWLQLIEYVSSHSQYICSGNSSYIAKSLADTIAWNTSTYACAIGNNLSLNNSTGFSALPAGTNDDEVFGFGNYGYF